MSLTKVRKTTKKKSSKLLRSRCEVGSVCNLKITALAANNIGIDDSSFAYAVFVPNATIGSQIKAKIVKVKNDASKAYAVGQLLEVTSLNTSTQLAVKPGDKLTVSIKKQIGHGKAGVVELANNFRLIVPLTNLQGYNNLNLLENIEVTVTRVKLNYAFAKIDKNIKKLNSDKNAPALGGTSLRSLTSNKTESLNSTMLEVGSKFTTTIDLSSGIKSFTKGNGKFLVLKVKDSILFLKLNNSVFALSSRQIVRVRVKITSKSANCVVGKVLQVNPMSKTKKMYGVLKNIREMINHGLHFGEKAVKCNARMKNYLWLTNSNTTLTGKNASISRMLRWQPRPEGAKDGAHDATKSNNLFANVPLVPAGSNATSLNGFVTITQTQGVSSLHSVPSKQGVPTALQNTLGARSGDNDQGAENTYYTSEKSAPLKKPLIKKGRHVINLLKTHRCLNQALKKLTQYALKNRTFLFIGTKKPAASLISRASFFTKNSFYVNTRWLGGMLTNWKTICKSISKIRPILKEKQKVMCNVLEKRQIIKKRLIKKALLLKQKSKVILNKGNILLQTLKKDKLAYISKSKQLTDLRNEFVKKGSDYIQKRQQLIQKRNQLISESILLKEKGLDLWLKHKTILNQLSIYAKKLRQYKYLLILTAEIQNIKNQTNNSNPNMALLSVSYSKLAASNQKSNAELLNQDTPTGNEASLTSVLGASRLPNPPKDFLNLMVTASLNAGLSNQSRTRTASQNQTDKLTNASTVNNAKINKRKNSIEKFIVCSTLLAKFSNFNMYVKSVIKSCIASIQDLQSQAKIYIAQLNKIQNTLQTYFNLKQKYANELIQLKIKFAKEKGVIRIVKRKLKDLEAQKKLLNFLPRLRYLPTPQAKISEIVQILLSRIVDPKLKYPIEQIYDQKLSSSSKKLAVSRKKKWQLLEKYFGGLSNMTKLTKTQISRNIAIIVGQNEEINAVRECKKLGIKMFTIVDTNCNPTLSDHIIPANDDSRSSIKYILTKFITRIRLAQKLRTRLSIYMAQ